MLRAALAGAATLLLLFVAAFPMTTGSAPIRGQVVSASPQVVSAVPKAPDPLPSAMATATPQKVPAAARDSMSPATIKPSPAPQPVAAPVVRSVTNSPLTVNGSGTGNLGVALWVRSTAYCEQGLMASGGLTYWGAVAMSEPFGSRWLVLSGPLAGQVFIAEDRYGWGTQFDVAMPGECGRARNYGLRVIQVVRVG
jgi:hypothetical protein